MVHEHDGGLAFRSLIFRFCSPRIVEYFGCNGVSVSVGNHWHSFILKVRWYFVLDYLIVKYVADVDRINTFVSKKYI